MSLPQEATAILEKLTANELDPESVDAEDTLISLQNHLNQYKVSMAPFRTS